MTTTSELDRARADAIHAIDSARQRAVAIEREIDQYEQVLATIPLGRLMAVMSTLAEHDNHIVEIYDRIAELTLEVRGG